MKRIVLAAAMLGLGTAAASAQTTASPWNGFYFGLHDGGGYGLARMATPQVAGGATGTFAFDRTGLTQGVFGGVQFGFSHQIGQAVLGIEANLSAANIDGQVNCGGFDLSYYGYICNTRLNALGTLTARAGFAAGDTQFYVNGGLAWARHSYSIREPFYAVTSPCPPCLSYGEGVDNAWGWTAGFGVEHQLSHGFSFRADYAYVRFPSRDVTLTSGVWPDTTVTVAQSYHLLSVGLNYRFGQDGTAMAGDAGAGGWDVEFGKRAWFDLGRYQYDLFDPISPSTQNSRLTYGPTYGFGGEAFLTATNAAGYFVSLRYGSGVSTGGVLIDEDFPPAISPYSATTSGLINGRLSYAGADLGFRFYNSGTASIGAFAGVTGLMERFEAFGCEQIATHPGICVPTIPSDYDVITQTNRWIGVRLGVNGEVTVNGNVTLHGEAAVMPLAFLYGVDNHWLRPDVNPIVSTGRGWGIQLEGGIDFAVNSQLTIGVGARYGQIWETGTSLFLPSTLAPQTATTRHLGAYLQATYAIGH